MAYGYNLKDAIGYTAPRPNTFKRTAYRPNAAPQRTFLRKAPGYEPGTQLGHALSEAHRQLTAVRGYQRQTADLNRMERRVSRVVR